MSAVTGPTTRRHERRDATRNRIADAASRRFGREGFERTTVRAIAADACVDPALVLHYFGSKEALFAAVSSVDPAATTSDAPTDNAVDMASAALASKLGDLAPEVMAGLRSILTHPGATQRARASFEREVADLAARLDGPTAKRRASLLLASNLGIALARELLEVPSLQEVSEEELIASYGPAIEALCGVR